MKRRSCHEIMIFNECDRMSLDFHEHAPRFYIFSFAYRECFASLRGVGSVASRWPRIIDGRAEEPISVHWLW